MPQAGLFPGASVRASSGVCDRVRVSAALAGPGWGRGRRVVLLRHLSRSSDTTGTGPQLLELARVCDAEEGVRAAATHQRRRRERSSHMSIYRARARWGS